MALRDFFGGVEAREEDAEGNEASAEFPEACSDRSQRTADAEALRGMGDDSPGFCRREVTERGRMEFSRDESRAITESGSGHENKIY